MRYSREPASVLHSIVWGQIRFAGEDDHGTAKPDKPTAWRDASRAVPHLLIVEDELFVAWELEAMVEDFGYVLCAVASRGEEAIQKAEEREPDLALVDVNLGGGIDGIEAARRMCEDAPIAIVFVTAYGDANTRARIEAAFPGAAIVDKPVLRSALRFALKSALERRHHGSSEGE